jgi:NAD(P)-dependent dehydrogenase (short-subunit alcohol dehydrogenase family)
VRTNLKGEYLFGRAVIPILIEQGSGGDIINIATDHMVTCGTPHDLCPHLDTCPWSQPNPEFAGPPRPTGGGDVMDLYDASKWGLNGLLYAWADALRAHEIRVNAICMGATDSHMLRGGRGRPDGVTRGRSRRAYRAEPEFLYRTTGRARAAASVDLCEVEMISARDVLGAINRRNTK